ncbi:helix-turn-helix domain-containing protein [Chromobacterium violaceum]|uniref:helix-turn-helix domain-containing protein n=1 Tax=Chromobacterium violaceum TaxID=536 RepID=UPI001E462554|nr:helix-turn-helix transcriptional regulator [Chromobacterium violaceum]MCD0493850.1 helix-turn-helix domain-containing protein [Chromobacterium violaceum]
MNGRGERIRAARKALGWSQEQLARRARVSRGIVGDLELGRNHGTTKILDIAKALRKNPVWLETGKGSQEPPASADTPLVSADSIDDLADRLLDLGPEVIGQLWTSILKKQAERR